MAAGADRRGCQGAVRPSAGRRRRRPGPGVLAGEVAQIPAKKSLPPCPRVLSTACLSHGPHSADTQCPEDKEHTHAPEGASLGFTVQIPG